MPVIMTTERNDSFGSTITRDFEETPPWIWHNVFSELAISIGNFSRRKLPLHAAIGVAA
jgi:hypothetical protein